jgi:hypothetical protein
MKIALLFFLAVLGGWIAVGEPYPVPALLQIMLLIPVLFIIGRTDEELWSAEPKKRVAAGLAALTMAALALVSLAVFIPLPRSTHGPFDQMMPEADQIVPAAAAAVFAGALLLSVRLIASSCLQSFNRWRYYRAKGS